MLGILDTVGSNVGVSYQNEIKIMRDSKDKEDNTFSSLTVGVYVVVVGIIVVGSSVVAVGILVVDVGCIDIEGSLDSLG